MRDIDSAVTQRSSASVTTQHLLETESPGRMQHVIRQGWEKLVFCGEGSPSSACFFRGRPCCPIKC